MKRTLNILLILIATVGYSQNNSESEVFRKIIDYEIVKGGRGMNIQCEKPKTSFDAKDFKVATGLNIPENVLKEIELNESKSRVGIWNSELINELIYNKDFIKNKECLTKKDAEKLFKKTKKRQNIISISEPIFDNKYENCVVSVRYWKFTGSAYGKKYFLKKVYGIWTVIVEYEIWMT
ncbi:hypothetical protein DCS32_11620 [Dokdonia sp. Dokd-P16]|uniref:hypothetical protein n=1 Tax=Dokdonia sp. Dokd-P16 TaxID=2173169 RepID=UPI000D5459AE|nr:hypothetical protein [Dokdonia sp. Dokd-P16]AWH74782.1 hypothetical protein DCS32_11620 [Dokdonia sp. Dokd-P16]